MGPVPTNTKAQYIESQQKHTYSEVQEGTCLPYRKVIEWQQVTEHPLETGSDAAERALH